MPKSPLINDETGPLFWGYPSKGGPKGGPNRPLFIPPFEPLPKGLWAKSPLINDETSLVLARRAPKGAHFRPQNRPFLALIYVYAPMFGVCHLAIWPLLSGPKALSLYEEPLIRGTPGLGGYPGYGVFSPSSLEIR